MATRKPNHGVADAVEREVTRSRSRTYTPPAYGRQSESRSASEPPKAKRTGGEQPEEVDNAVVIAQYQERLRKLRERELDLENEQRIEEAKLEIVAKERRNRQLQHKIHKTRKMWVNMQEESEGGVKRGAQLKSQSASSKEKWNSPSQAERPAKEEMREKRGQKTVKGLAKKREYTRKREESMEEAGPEIWEEWAEEWAEDLAKEEEEKKEKE